MTIKDLTNYLRQLRITYQGEFDRIEETAAAAQRRLDTDYVKNSPSYKKEMGEIQLSHEVSIVQLQSKTAKDGLERIQAMREQELMAVGRVDETTLGKINALGSIPLTQAELQQLVSKYGNGNYWTARALAALAERNGIEAGDLNLTPPIDTKLNVLDQLEEQLNKIISDYNPKSNEKDAVNAKLLYLNDNILARANNLFEGKSGQLSATDTVSRAYAQITAQSGRMSQAVMISNTLRNLKNKPEGRNELLYRLSQNTEISNETFAVAGVLDEVTEWKNGKARLYTESAKLTDTLKFQTETASAKSMITAYRDRLRESGIAENPFFEASLKDLQRSNTAVMDAVAELGGVRMEDAPEMEMGAAS